MNYRNPRFYKAASCLLLGSVISITSIGMAKGKDELAATSISTHSQAVTAIALTQPQQVTHQRAFAEEFIMPVAPWQHTYRNSLRFQF